MPDVYIYIAIGIFLLGLVVQGIRFVLKSKGFKANRSDRAGISFTPIKAFFNLLFQYRLFKAGKIRWLGHFLVFSGYLYLVLIHALHFYTSQNWFADYWPTLDPFQFLRNLAALFVLLGSLGFAARRFGDMRIRKDRRMRFKGMLAVFLVVFVVISGILLEAGKMVSEPVFMRMVADYSDLEAGDDLDDLKMVWQKKYGAFFGNLSPAEPGRFENGEELHEMFCMSCHSDTGSAFLSKGTARLIQKGAPFLNRVKADEILYILHLTACLVLLALLPFSKMLHILTIPFAGLKHQTDRKTSGRTGFGLPVSSLWACTQCGFCSEVCSVYPHFQVTGNMDALPHSKVETLKRLSISSFHGTLPDFSQGNNFCTQCGRCTDICPSAIDLKSIWKAADQYLGSFGVKGASEYFLEKHHEEKFSFEETREENGSENITVNSKLIGQSDDFETCIQCTVCTSVCPVVDHDGSLNDFTPHQVMNLVRLGQIEAAESSRMVWTCLTCYSCQEACPQGIHVTDILLELRSKAAVKAYACQQHQLREKI